MPSWLSVVWKCLPWAVCALGIMFGVWERGSAMSAEASLASFQAQDAQAVAAQKVADAATSAALIKQRDADEAALQDQINQLMEKVHNAPVTNSCGPVVRDAARGVRDILGGAGH